MNKPYTIKRKLGSGGCGETFLVEYHGIEAVLKKTEGDSKIIKEEAEKMMKLHCRYCVHIIDVIDCEGETGIIMEYCPHKSLSDILKKCKENNQKLSERGILKLFCEIVLGLKYLHNHNVLHLDLKPDNIFVTQDNMCVLGDFGTSVDIENIDKIKGYRGTEKYSAPEILCSKQKYHKPVDIYSLGLILYEMCKLESFFSKATSRGELIDMQYEDNSVYISQMNGIPSYIPNGIKRIIKQCLKQNAYDRPSIEDIYHEDIIQNFIQKGITDFLYEYDSIENITLKNNWKEILSILNNKNKYKLLEKRNAIIDIFSHYRHTDFMLEEEISNIWQLIYWVSRNIGRQLLLDTHYPNSKIGYYKTEEYEDLTDTWEQSDYMTKIFPKMLEYLYAHRYNDEADAIVEALCKERIKLDVKNNFKYLREKYKH